MRTLRASLSSALFVATLALSPALQAEEAPPRILDVTGQGVVYAAPTQATVTFGIEARGPELGKVRQEVAGNADQVIRAIRQLNLKGLQLQTAGIDINPIYERRRPGPENSDQPPRIEGYHVATRVTAELRGPEGAALADQVIRIIDAALGAGANRLYGLSWGAANEEELRRQALAQAVDNARANAQVLARQAGVQLGDVRQILMGSVPGRPGPVGKGGGYRAMADEAAPIPVEAGQLRYATQVEIIYEID